ncbi:MAG: cobalamin-binding protein [Nitrospira sp.]|nr:cobalamin-binding protein [Nitrospira sp.]
MLSGIRFVRGRRQTPGRKRALWFACVLTVTALVVPVCEPLFGFSDHSTTMKRRQQGILTGMPFMANVAPRTFVDDLGRKLYLAQPPKRIVSLAPSITEMLFALGLDREIIGVTEFCNYPPAALDKPKVGYAQPNLESIVALEPELIVAPKSFLRVDLLNRLEQLKIPTVLLDAQTVEDILRHIQLLGRMVGRVPESLKVTETIRKQMTVLTDPLAGRPRPTLLFVINTDPLITVGPGSYIHQLIELAGARNAAEQAGTPYPRLSIEEVLRQNPEFLLFPTGQFEGIPQAEQDQWRRWTSLEAVKRNQFVHINSDILNRPGPRVIEALKALITILHPDAVPSATGQEE